MKNFTKLSVILFTAAALFTGSAIAQTKIATVNIQELFEDYHRTATEQQKIAEEFARINKENNDRMETMREIEAQLANLRKKIEDTTLAEKVRTEAKNTFETKINEGRAMEQERKDSYERRRGALEAQKQASIQSIRDEIMNLVTEHAKTEDYDYVFDKSGVSQNQLPFLIHSKESINITEELKVKLNKDAPAPAEKAAE